MKLSAFDPNHDGKCDPSVCRKRRVHRHAAVHRRSTRSCQADLAKIGIEIVPRDLSVTTAFTALFTIKNRTPMSPLGGGYADYTGTYSFAQPNFWQHRDHRPVECCNYSLMGLTKAQAKKSACRTRREGSPTSTPRSPSARRSCGTARRHVLGELRQVHDDQGDGLGPVHLGPQHRRHRARP